MGAGERLVDLMRGRSLGQRGERLAAEFLRQNGYEVIESNSRALGGEIDLVARDDGEYVFIEVKTRVRGGQVPAEEAVTPEKLKHMERSAETFLVARGLEEAAWRIELIAIDVSLDGEIEEIRLVRDLG